MQDLSPQQSQAAILLAAGVSCKEVASQVGVTPQTISSWRADRDFQLCAQRLQWEIFREQQSQLRSLVSEALEEVRSLMLNSESESIRLRAALEILKGSAVLGREYRNGQLWRYVDEYYPV